MFRFVYISLPHKIWNTHSYILPSIYPAPEHVHYLSMMCLVCTENHLNLCPDHHWFAALTATPLHLPATATTPSHLQVSSYMMHMPELCQSLTVSSSSVISYPKSLSSSYTSPQHNYSPIMLDTLNPRCHSLG